MQMNTLHIVHHISYNTFSFLSLYKLWLGINLLGMKYHHGVSINSCSHSCFET